MFSISLSSVPLRSAGTMLFGGSLALAFGLIATAAPSRADDSSGQQDTVIAKVGTHEIHLSDLQAASQQISAQDAQQYSRPQLYKLILDNLVGEQLIADAAQKAVKPNDPDVKRLLAAEKLKIVASVYVHHIELAAANDDDALHDLYNKILQQNPSAMQEAHARHILVKTEDEAKEIIGELDKGGDFAAIATARSEDKGSSAGGDLPWFGPGQMVKEFSDAAFALKKGAYTETPVHTSFGWHVIQLLDTRTTPFEDAKPGLQQLAAQRALGEEVQKLKSVAKVQEFQTDGVTPLTQDN